MSKVNINQLLCRNISESGETLSEIFDTLICEPGKINFYVCLLFSQIVNSEAAPDAYYYRLVLRHVNERKIHFRVDSGFLWDSENPSGQISQMPTTKKGASGKIIIDCCFDIQSPGYYEVDLYSKKVDASDSDGKEKLRSANVRDLELLSIAPIQIIFRKDTDSGQETPSANA